MPKTKDAFAFRGFDRERILQRPYFRQWREVYHVGDDLSDKEIVASVTIYYSDSNVDMCEFDNEKLKSLMMCIFFYQKKIQRHANTMTGRLERYRRAVYNQIPNVTENFSLQSRLDRVEEMTRVYIIDASKAIGDLFVEVKKHWQDSEQNLQVVYRRRFGERLKSAREAAGLTRKDMAVKCSLSVQQIHYYENGQREPNLTSLKRFARTLKVSEGWLLE